MVQEENVWRVPRRCGLSGESGCAVKRHAGDKRCLGSPLVPRCARDGCARRKASGVIHLCITENEGWGTMAVFSRGPAWVPRL